jgi:NitT/TauT family transport system substrate-binding protein
VNWAKLAGPSVMVDAILSGNLHFSAQGVPSLALMWDRTKGGIGVRAVSAITNTDIYLNTRNPNIKSIRDFTEKDRIALPSVRRRRHCFCRRSREGVGPGQHTSSYDRAAHPDGWRQCSTRWARSALISPPRPSTRQR